MGIKNEAARPSRLHFLIIVDVVRINNGEHQIQFYGFSFEEIQACQHDSIQDR